MGGFFPGPQMTMMPPPGTPEYAQWASQKAMGLTPSGPLSVNAAYPQGTPINPVTGTESLAGNAADMATPQLGSQLQMSSNAGVNAAMGGAQQGLGQAAMQGAKNFATSVPFGIGSALSLAMTDWDDPSSIGGTLGGIGGSVAGTAAGTAAASAGIGSGMAMGASMGSILPGIGTIIGGTIGALGGSALGGMFGESEEEKAQKEAEKRRRMQMFGQGVQDFQRQAQGLREQMDHVTSYFNQTNSPRV